MLPIFPNHWIFERKNSQLLKFAIFPKWPEKGLASMSLNVGEMLSARFLVCFNFQSASMSSKVGINVVWVSNSLEVDETASYSPSHPDPSWLHMALSSCLAVKCFSNANFLIGQLIPMLLPFVQIISSRQFYWNDHNIIFGWD